MTDRHLTKTYEPNPILAKLYERFFRNIRVDEAWIEQVRSLSARGGVVYVLRSLNFIDFLALDHLTKRYDLPQIRFVNDLGLWILNPMGKGWLNAIVPRRGITAADELGDALEDGGSAALFLKRPPGVLDVAAGASGGRGLKEGDELVRALFTLQRSRRTPILLVPQVFVWTNQPDKRSLGPLDFLLGPREWPSAARTAGQFLYNYRHVALKAGEPLDLQHVLDGANGLSDDTLIRRVTYTMLRRLERERRSITGPAKKPPDRERLEIVRSPRLQATIHELAGERPVDRAVLTGRALGMLRELQATPELGTIKGLEVVFNRVIPRIYAGIEYDRNDIERLRSAAREGTLVLLPSHKSHVDYLVLGYVFHEQNLPLPMIAAGDNLNFFPLGPVFRRAGAFFIRRSFKGDRLYTAVVDAYIRRLLREGYPIELFLEGGRSRTGKLVPPKFGLLNMIVDAVLGVPQREVYFVPVSIGYEHLVEARAYEHELSGGEKQKEDAAGLLASSKVLRYRYGRISIQIGHLLTLEQMKSELGLGAMGSLTPAKRRSLVTRLGNRVMDEINRVTAVTPGALTALGLLCQPHRGIAHDELVELCNKLLTQLSAVGARVPPTALAPDGRLRSDAIREAVELFVRAELVVAHAPELGGSPRHKRAVPVGPGALYSVVEDKRLALDMSKNIIVHFFLERALMAVALRMERGPHPRAAVRERVLSLSRLFKFEFRFHADATFDAILERTVHAMIDDRILVEDGEEFRIGSGADGWDGERWIDTYASILKNFLEGYRIAARSLSQLVKGAATQKDAVKRALATGHRMYLAGDVSRREAVSKPLIENAYLAFADQGYLQTKNGKIELSASFASLEAVKAIEGRIATYLGEVAP